LFVTGATGIIIMNTDGEAFFMATTGNEGRGVTIPAVMVSQADGEAIKTGAQQGTQASIAPKVLYDTRTCKWVTNVHSISRKLSNTTHESMLRPAGS
jgi:hypothetical protein